MKKTVELKKFNNFTDSGIKVDKFYNFYPKQQLKSCFKIIPAKFPKKPNSDIYDELTGLEPFNFCGVCATKQYYYNIKENVYTILIYGDNNKIYLNQLFNGIFALTWLYEMTFETPPISLSYKNDENDAIILASENKMMIWKTNHSPYQVEDVPIITSMCMNEGVLFCTIRQPAFKIWYATDLDAENVGNISAFSDYITLADDLGDARKVITFDGEVYVFRDYGISKISYLQKNVTVSQIYSSNSKIIANSVSVCGNSIMFLTFDGIYTFNGVKVKKTDIDIHTQLDGNNANAVASSLGNYYYLALKLKYDDTDEQETNFGNNSILIVDITDFSYQLIRGVDSVCLYPLKTDLLEKMLLLTNNDKTRLFEIANVNETETFEDLVKFYETSDLIENENVKLISALKVDCAKDVGFNLICDGNKKLTFTTKNDGVSAFNFRLNCRKVKVQIVSKNPNAHVNRLALDYYDY